ncbi:MAG: hypothetical protein A2W75_03785 [Nitrospinae bacterium RIFCSPLOWO2_12_39_15]|nr:MAG: hypothetical protein A2W75_03785 [Nitrospinae bacterium RIFCSPLOWO2_12_39_15]OHB99518.1 MAG: hypothetical protein A2Z57_04760 [Planctomycetes bacterium RIFCSPHIGHO2_12_39_6]
MLQTDVNDLNGLNWLNGCNGLIGLNGLNGFLRNGGFMPLFTWIGNPWVDAGYFWSKHNETG